MSWLKLDPESLAARATEAGARARVPTLGVSLAIGAGGFAFLALAGFAPWALAGHLLYPFVTEEGVFALCAAVFVLLSGPLLHWLIIGPGSLWRFYAIFAPGFCVYGAAYTVCYIAMRGTLGGALGLLIGTAVMALLFVAAFRAWRKLLIVFLALFLSNCAGYFGGEYLYELALETERLPTYFPVLQAIALAGLLWGLCFGVCFGLGLGLALYWCQSRARELIRTRGVAQ